MFPKSFSASAITVASLCLKRYAAENFKYGERMSNDAATLGTIVHQALELFVQAVYLRGDHDDELKFLLDLYDLAFLQHFGKIDKDSVDYKDGLDMLKRWHKRGDLRQPGRKVISCEQKTNFMVKIAGYPETPFNYIWDRFDQTGEKEYTVVDYKSNRWALNHDDLRKKPQARAYGLAAQIAFPDAERIWVEFDFLRHEGGPVGTVFTRKDNIQTWKQFKAEFQRIWDTDADAAPATLNEQCNFCVLKTTCPAVRSNVDVGGVLSLGDIDTMVDARAKLDAQAKAALNGLKEIDAFLLEHCKDEDVLEIKTDTSVFRVGISSRRGADPNRVRKVIGEELWSSYGSETITMGDIDKLLKGGELTPEQKIELKGLIGKTYGEPKGKSEILNTFSGP